MNPSTDERLRAHLDSLPSELPPPPALLGRLQRHVGWRRARRRLAPPLALAAALALVWWMPQDQAVVPTVPGPAAGDPGPLDAALKAELVRLDHSLQAAYARHAPEEELAALHAARAELIASGDASVAPRLRLL